MRERERILYTLYRMKVGERYNIDRLDFYGNFGKPRGFSNIPPLDDLLENLPGSNYGEYKAEQLMDGAVVVSRHEGGERRVRHDWCRR